MATVDEGYLSTVAAIVGFLKVVLIAASVPALGIVTGLNSMTMQDITFGSIFVGAILGMFGAIAYGMGIISLLVTHLNDRSVSRLLFADLLITMSMLVLVVRTPMVFSSAGVFYGLLSIVGIIVSPLVILDPDLLKATRLIGILLFLGGLILKFATFPSDLADVFVVSGGVSAVIGLGEHAR